ncbi:hypothetical protein D3Z38_17325 [Clostridiales bacterium]|nr:hypothetical protein [Clostridiales bacterium]
MEHTSVTLLICIAAELMWLSNSINGIRRKEWPSSFAKYSDYFWTIVGIPFLIFTVVAFFRSL